MIDEDKLNALELFGENEYLHKEIERLHSIIKEAREYIEEYCIDDEFYINLTNKEKHIIEVLNILKGSDKE